MRALKVMCKTQDGSSMLLEADETEIMMVPLLGEGITTVWMDAPKARRLAAWLIEAADIMDGVASSQEEPEVI